MKNLKLVILAFIVVIFSIPALSAHEGHGFGPGKEMKKGPGPRPGFGRRDKGKSMEKVLDELALNKKQKEKITKLREENQKNREEARKKLREKREELRNALKAEKTDKKKINKIADKIKKLEAKKIDARIDHILKIKEILTPEQFKKLNEKMAEKRKMKRGRREKRRGRRRDF